MMKKILLFVTSILCLFVNVDSASGQTFTFECVCAHVSNDTCDICPIVPGLQSRSFHGLLIRRNGTPYKWIDEPYTVKKFANGTIEFLEMIPNPDKIIIARFQTPFATMQGFADSTNCVCNLGGGMSTVAVDTPIVGDGSPGNPITIGQFGADTTMFLNWNGSHWYPGKIQFSDLLFDLPYFKSDSAAIAAGLMAGDPYLLECDNDYSLPAGIFKVVKICGWDCTFTIKFYPSDIVAAANGIPPGREYALSQTNIFGLLYGFIKTVATDTLTNDTLICNTSRPHYDNDFAALTGGLATGDIYNMTVANTYGSPYGVQRIVSTSGLTSADPPVCCDINATLPYYNNDSAAITGGLTSGDYYYLSITNTLGFPWGTKKRVQ